MGCIIKCLCMLYWFCLVRVQYLGSVRPLLNDKEYTEMEGLVEDFKVLLLPSSSFPCSFSFSCLTRPNMLCCCLLRMVLERRCRDTSTSSHGGLPTMWALLLVLFDLLYDTIVTLTPLPSGDRLVGDVRLPLWTLSYHDQQQLLCLCMCLNNVPTKSFIFISTSLYLYLCLSSSTYLCPSFFPPSRTRSGITWPPYLLPGLAWWPTSPVHWRRI